MLSRCKPVGSAFALFSAAYENDYDRTEGERMKFKKWGLLVAAGAVAAVLALAGCTSSQGASGSSSSAASTDGDYGLVKEGTLTIATSPDFPPFENMENGEYVGLDIEIGKAVAEKLGLTPEFKTLQFDAIIPAIAGGGQADMGISGFSVDPERAKQVDFTESYYIDDQAIAVMKGSSVTSGNVTEALNSSDMVIAVQSGSTGESYVQENFPNAKVQAFGNSTDCFAAMQSGNANAVCTNKAVVEQMLKDAYTDAEVVKAVATGEEYAAVISKDNPALTAAVNKALAELKSDGTIDSLVKQYL